MRRIPVLHSSAIKTGPQIANRNMCFVYISCSFGSIVERNATPELEMGETPDATVPTVTQLM